LNFEFYFIFIPNSFSCSSATAEGASITAVLPAVLTGKAITSRMLSSPERIAGQKKKSKGK